MTIHSSIRVRGESHGHDLATEHTCTSLSQRRCCPQTSRPSAPLLGRPCLLFVPCGEQQGTLGTLGLTRHPVFCCAQPPQLL